MRVFIQTSTDPKMQRLRTFETIKVLKKSNNATFVLSHKTRHSECIAYLLQGQYSLKNFNFVSARPIEFSKLKSCFCNHDRSKYLADGVLFLNLLKPKW